MSQARPQGGPHLPENVDCYNHGHLVLVYSQCGYYSLVHSLLRLYILTWKRKNFVTGLGVYDNLCSTLWFVGPFVIITLQSQARSLVREQDCLRALGKGNQQCDYYFSPFVKW